MSRQIVLDTETTGLEAREHRIIEIGCIEMRGRRFVGEQRWYLNPDRDSDPGALEVHGLTTQFLSDKPRFAQIVNDLVSLLRGAEIIIHNAPFDVGFLDAEFQRAGRMERVAQLGTVTDTVPMAKKLHPGQRASLDALCKRYGVDNSHRELHGALLDARLLAEVYLAMTGGQAALGLASDADGPLGRSPSRQSASPTSASGTPLRVIPPNDDEQVAHRERLAGIVKKSGRTLWPGELPD
ncbi:DNA polymerase III subunit epsilon [Nevskia sp.]|uniref:DNA polymerase III subunit epsilon n=1 Tax=Nevskia sp. TaxID=1929292 RepID=UPI0025F7DB58|nr:DNA polymerase III subunit epsilon [Nevskia sp.]